ncbi:MAG TPA: hypothetical protein VEA15_08540 [Caulobacteraceae bacterium]|nr:hypothetical protein [Caulobacteraceae bacterium]
MSVYKRYLSHAAECERLARTCDREEEREAFLSMAIEWRKLADTADRTEPPPRTSPLH